MARVKYYDAVSKTWKYADESGYVAPVQSVNGKTGAVILSADDIPGLGDKCLLAANYSVKKAQLTLEDGSVVLIDVLVASEGTAVDTYTNQIPISTDTDGSVYNGTGWKGGSRLSGSSGTVKDQANAAVTGFIPVAAGDIVRMRYTGTDAIWEADASASANVIAYYDASKTWLGSLTLQPSYYGICTEANAPSGVLADGGIVSFVVPQNTSIGFVRISLVSQTSNISGLIVTVNEEIT